MSAFDLDAFRGVHRPWTFTAGHRTYVARPVSTEQVLAFRARCIGASPLRQEQELRALLRIAFPWRWGMVWFGGDPVRVIMGSTPREREAILADFFGSLQSRGPSPTPAPTRSTSS